MAGRTSRLGPTGADIIDMLTLSRRRCGEAFGSWEI